jgi:hypothetical protein
MNRVRFSEVLDAASSLAAGKPYTDTSREITAGLRRWINRAAQEFWTIGPWPEWSHTEQRWFAPFWDLNEVITTYSTLSEPVWRFYAPDNTYYQVLAEPQPLLPPPDDEVNWAPAALVYSGDYYDNATSYTLGDVVQSPYNARFYQGLTVAPTSLDTSDDPTAQGWGVLTTWINRIEFSQTGKRTIGTVLGIFAEDPRTNANAERFRWSLDPLGVVVYTHATSVWVTYRLPAPDWSGSTYAAGTTYAADEQVWSAEQGDYYRSLQDANTGHAVTDTAWWERIDFPRVLRDAVADVAAAMSLRTDGDTDATFASAMQSGSNSLLRQMREAFNRQPSSGLMTVRN